ncbi:hypothetical protein LTR78_009747 [Recurvomyces mirabilis]|uniref:PRISE-like Rossmann-fold domain-containing protein n=1 Tax=Recurvomyces mirabilis TaxID=574656 RepID=A0AAE0TNC1_9PEZI|nr:hypothetical protein LTR78_009747 [Recurvomyces mirabilis]KAK5156370.1 hypothetical protein LTS14_005258 [Recurvomyces mirabilis]
MAQPNVKTEVKPNFQPQPHVRTHSEAIYHGLPILPTTTKPEGHTAIITGANGISGSHILRHLSANPSRWKHIYACSRSPPANAPRLPDHVTFVSVDLLSSSPGEIASALIQAGCQRIDYVFFFAYVLVTSEEDGGALNWEDERLVQKNTTLLANTLDSLPILASETGSKLPKRITIQYGGKWYGLHLGLQPVPMLEDPERTGTPQPPLIPGYEDKNLYYTQHAVLTAFCTEHPEVTWTAGLPPYIIGSSSSTSTPQTLLYPLLVYASVQKYLGRSLDFPGSAEAWQAPQSLADASLNALQYEWQALSPQTENQMFNVSNDDTFNWAVFWPVFAKYFGVGFTGPADTTTSAQGKASFSFVVWANDKKNQVAWKVLAATHSLQSDKWDNVGAIFGRADGALTDTGAKIMSTMKAKKYGWFGCVDSIESIMKITKEFIELEIIPDPARISLRN